MGIEKEDVNEAYENYIDALGEFLEHNEFSDDEIDEYFLEHHGVKGMKWGQRRQRRAQNRIDRFARVAEGTGSRRDRQTVARTMGTFRRDRTQRAAARGLRNTAELQRAIRDGDARVADIINRIGGVRISELNIPQTT